jgi:hypothetical protein
MPERHFQRHDVGFAQRIDRGIGHLSEPLLTVIPQGPVNHREESGRRVVAHAPIGFFASQERAKQDFILIVGPARRGRHALRVNNRRALRGIFQTENA